MERLTDSIWIARPVADTDRPALAVVKGRDRTLMVDAGNSPRHAQQFLEALDREGISAPDYVVLTHAHCDHVFGLATIPGLVLANALTDRRISELNALCWSDPEVSLRVARGLEHEMTAHMLREEMPGDRAGFRIRPPDLVYDTAVRVELGDLGCRAEHVGGDHSADSTIIYVARERVLFVGDCLYLRSDDPAIATALYDQLLSFDADLYVDAHEAVPLTRSQVERRREALRET